MLLPAREGQREADFVWCLPWWTEPVKICSILQSVLIAFFFLYPEHIIYKYWIEMEDTIFTRFKGRKLSCKVFFLLSKNFSVKTDQMQSLIIKCYYPSIVTSVMLYSTEMLMTLRFKYAVLLETICDFRRSILPVDKKSREIAEMSSFVSCWDKKVWYCSLKQRSLF